MDRKDRPRFFPGELVIMVIRGDQAIIPKGDTVIEENDLLVVNLSGTP